MAHSRLKLLFVLLLTICFAGPAYAQLTETFSTYVNGLSAASSVSGSDLLYVLQSGVSKKVTASTLGTGGGVGVFNVRTGYGGVPDGSTINNTAIAAAFTASNAFTNGVPTVFFDCDTSTTTCVYKYNGSGTSPINPTIATSIVCAPGVTLDYTGSAHAADIGALSNSYQLGVFTVQGCRWIGGVSYTAGIYIHNGVFTSGILNNQFYNFGNQTGYTIAYGTNTFQPSVIGNTWEDEDGTTRNVLDYHNVASGGLIFSHNLLECGTGVIGVACSIVTFGVGLWVCNNAIIDDNILQFHYPLLLVGSISCNGTNLRVTNNHFEGNSGTSSPAITFGDPGGTAANTGVGSIFENNFFYWPAASTVPIVGPNTPASGSYNLSGSHWRNNLFANSPTGGAPFINTNGGIKNVFSNNFDSASTLITQAYSPPILDTGFATEKAYFGLLNTLGLQSVANEVMAFDSTGTVIQAAGYHNLANPLQCVYSGSNGTVQSCSTSPVADPFGVAFTLTAGDLIIYTSAKSNTGALTLNVNSTGPAPVQKSNGSVALTGGEIAANFPVILVFDGTNWDITVPGGGGGSPGGSNTYVQFNSSSSFGGDSGFTYAGSGQATLALGTITTNLKALTITGTWNNGSTTFDAPLFMNITETARSFSSLLVDIQNSGSPVFTIDWGGFITLVGFQQAGNTFYFDSSGGRMGSSSFFGFTSGAAGQSPDTTFAREAVGVVGVLNDNTKTNPTGVHVYNTTDTLAGAPTNYERVVVDFTTTTNVATIGTQASGTGTQRALALVGSSISMATIANSATTSALCYNTSTGVVTYDGTIGTCTTSTMRVKHDIQELDSNMLLDGVLRMRPVSFEYNAEMNTPGEQLGLIAEDLERIDPNLVAYDSGGQPVAIKWLGPVFSYLIGAIQEQQHEIEQLKARLH